MTSARSITCRNEMLTASLQLGTMALPLEEFATTGLRSVVIASSGVGKTSLALLIGEQLAEQGWVSVFVDPEHEIASLYGDPVKDEHELEALLETRERSIIVVSATDATEFTPYGEVIMAAAERYRKPIYLFIDEGQLFSAARRRGKEMAAATEVVDNIVSRGRKRALDTFLTANRYIGTLSRSVFATKTLTFIGRQEDPTAWSALSMQFQGTGVTFKDLIALEPGQFYCFSRRGCEKIKVPMAAALSEVALAARSPAPALPASYMQWDRAMRALPTTRLEALTGPVVELLSSVAGLGAQQSLAGARALRDELDARS